MWARVGEAPVATEVIGARPRPALTCLWVGDAENRPQMIAD